MSQCSLYLISPPRIVLSTFLHQLVEALETDAVASFQLRLKDADDAEIVEAAKEIRPICYEKSVAFILNDRPELAVECDLDGVHLGQDDMGVAEARAIIGPDRIIGVSCHASRELAIEAGEQGADYVAFGAFYPTKSKPMEKIEKWGMPTPEILEWWSSVMTLPCVAIGGITPENCGPLAAAGADFVAVITAVWEHKEGAGAGVRAFAEKLHF